MFRASLKIQISYNQRSSGMQPNRWQEIQIVEAVIDMVVTKTDHDSDFLDVLQYYLGRKPSDKEVHNAMDWLDENISRLNDSDGE